MYIVELKLITNLVFKKLVWKSKQIPEHFNLQNYVIHLVAGIWKKHAKYMKYSNSLILFG